MAERSLIKDIERFAPWIAGTLIAAPILLTHYPPVGDVPLHESIVGLLRHWGDPKFVPPGVYALNLGQANQLFYILITLVAFVMPVAAATKLTLAAMLFGFAVAVGRLADHLGVTRFTALLLAPLGLGWMFSWGLIASILGLDVLVWALPSLDRFARRPDNRGLAVACGWITLLHFSHYLAGFIAAGALVLFTLASWRGWEKNVVRLFPVFVLMVLVASSFVLASGHEMKEHDRQRGMDWASTSEKLAGVADALYSDRLAGASGATFLFAFCQLAVLVFALERWTRRARGRSRPWREWIYDFRYEILGFALVAAYFVAPVRVAWTTHVYRRFLSPACVLLTVSACARGPLARPWLLPRVIACLAPIVSLFLVVPRFGDSSRLYAGLDAMIAHMEPGSAAIVIHVGPPGPFPQLECGNTDGHIVGALGGRVYFDYTTQEISPVYQRAEAQWDTLYQRINWATPNFAPPYDMTHYRYVVVHSPQEDLLDVGLTALQPEGKLVAREGEWMLVESTLPLVPLDAPDEPTPSPPPMTFGYRLWLLSRGGGPANGWRRP